MQWARSKTNTQIYETFETFILQRLEKPTPQKNTNRPPTHGCNESTPCPSSSKIKDGRLKSDNEKIKLSGQNDSINSRLTQSRRSRRETRRQSDNPTQLTRCRRTNNQQVATESPGKSFLPLSPQPITQQRGTGPPGNTPYRSLTLLTPAAAWKKDGPIRGRMVTWRSVGVKWRSLKLK